MAITKLQMVNYVLKYCRHAPVSALDSTGLWPSKTYGTSDAGQVESIIDMLSESIIARGWQCTSRFFSQTLGVAGTITLPTNTVAAMPVGKHENRSWHKENNTLLVYDAELSTTTLPADSYQFKVQVAVEPHTLSDPALIMLIQREAAREYQAMIATDQRIDQFLAERQSVSEVSAKRILPTIPKPANAALIPSNPQAQ